MSKVKRTKHLRRKSGTDHLITGGTKMMMMTRRKRGVSIATVSIMQQKIADTSIQKKLMTNFESNISQRSQENWS
jgi:hypothetical protein